MTSPTDDALKAAHAMKDTGAGEGACCAHMTVRYTPTDNGDGTLSEFWGCRDCQTEFLPKPRIRALEEANRALVEALRPFAHFSSKFGRLARDDSWVITKDTPSGKLRLTMGDVRKAEDVLE